MSEETQDALNYLRRAADAVITLNNDEREKGLDVDSDAAEAEMHVRRALTAMAKRGKL